MSQRLYGTLGARRSLPAALLGVASTLGACASNGTEPATSTANSRELRTGASDEACPGRLAAPAELPNTPAEVQQLSYWQALYGEDAERPLLDEAALRAHNEAMRFEPDGTPRIVDLQTDPGPDLVQETLRERLAFMQDRLRTGAYRVDDDEALERFSQAPETFAPARSLHVVLEPLPVRCGPYLGSIGSSEADARHDRNNCSTAHPGELLEVLGHFAGARLVRTRFSVGFTGEDAPLSPALPESERGLWLTGPRARLQAALEVDGVQYAEGRTLPVRDSGELRVATEDGFRDVAARTAPIGAPVTRGSVLAEAFRYLGQPYGWGGEGGGRDCSRYLMDVFQGVGLDLPRASGAQSLAGRYSVEVPEQASATDRLALLDAAQQRGLVLIRFPGHIMLYLGRDRDGVPRAIHSFAEYLEPCERGGETLYEVDRVAVSDLSLGEGSSRTSFLERITRLTVLGDAPGYELLAFTQFRQSAPPPPVPRACEDTLDLSMWRSPRVPVADTPMRAIVTSHEDTRPGQLWLFDPSGEARRVETEDLGVGPFARVAQLTPERSGRWTMLLTDGPRVLACERFNVVASPLAGAQEPRSDGEPAWEARFRWERDMEGLYAAFVEHLYSHPVEDTRTWASLTELLRDPQRNLLWNHLGMDEDGRLKLEPDCADLPYFLRAYFAWKLSLPFGFRRCSRGRAGVPPRCGDVITNELSTPGRDAVAAFEYFALRAVRPGVHSASNRTLPGDPKSDMYPLPLTRRALKPGTVFNDPYGHLIVVAKWVPQGLEGAGMLLGADAQPDATVGRRRFWRGSFLFTPSTDDVGAGFKAFRPLGRLEPDGPLVPFDADMIDDSRHHPDPSRTQYTGTAADFYARMDSLIYPRPLAPAHRIRMLVDALEEQVTRRVSSVDNGEAWVRDHGLMPMPNGYAIFQTQGPWEDFATPSRDMRLLIAIDTVVGLPELVAQAPERFGFAAGTGEQAAKRVRAQLREELARRSFTYTGSGDRTITLTLRDVVDRADALEMAYNPNDCMEIRWGAPEDAPEMRGCKRHAPPAQRAKMERYRAWFDTRIRPARP